MDALDLSPIFTDLCKQDCPNKAYIRKLEQGIDLFLSRVEAGAIQSTVTYQELKELRENHHASTR